MNSRPARVGIGRASVVLSFMIFAASNRVQAQTTAEPPSQRFQVEARADFIEVSREAHHAAPPNDFDFAFVTYRRVGVRA